MSIDRYTPSGDDVLEAADAAEEELTVMAGTLGRYMNAVERGGVDWQREEGERIAQTLLAFNDTYNEFLDLHAAYRADEGAQYRFEERVARRKHHLTERYEQFLDELVTVEADAEQAMMTVYADVNGTAPTTLRAYHGLAADIRAGAASTEELIDTLAQL